MTAPAGIPVFVRFFRSAAQLQMDRTDVKRFRDFVDGSIDDIAVAGRDAARWNGRDVIAPQDLPITKGLQERMREFAKLEDADEIRAKLAQTLRRPPADVTFSDETEQRLVELFGGLSLALARAFRAIDPEVVNPTTQHWDRVTDIFRQVL